MVNGIANADAPQTIITSGNPEPSSARVGRTAMPLLALTGVPSDE